MNKHASPNTNRVFQVCLALTGAWFLMPSNAIGAAFNFQTINNNADLTFNQLLSINNAGTIAGYFGSGTPNNTPPPFTLHPNKGYTVVPPYGQANFTNENFPGSSQTQVTGINNFGTTVGFYADSNGATTPNFFGFVDQSGTFTSVFNPATTGTPTTNQLLGLNNSNIAAGFYNDAAGNAHAYLYNIATHAFSSIIVPGATSATATDINTSGIVSGFFTAANGNMEGFLYNGTTFQTFEAPGSTSTMFLGLNNNGQVVGTYIDSAMVMHGLLANFNSSDVVSGLTNIDDPFGIGTTTINGINDLGDMVGFYVDGNDNTDGLLATPVPEPASMGLTLLGGLGAALFARRRRKL